ncbi:tol-pal system protein YbgF [Rhabdochromatium marinum]|nr:tol-pal system protein YbgF [Rhabdochromatium marinum]
MLVTASASADPMLEARVAKLERMLSEQRQSDLLLQIQQLKQEVQNLRGMVEKQQFQLQHLRSPASETTAQSTEAFPPKRPAPPPPTLDAPGTEAAPGSRFSLPGLETNPGPGTLTELPPADSRFPALPQPETENGGERDAYREAFEYLKARNQEAARTAFEELLQRFPRGEFADNSRYWLGEISYQDKDYPEARAAFEQLIQDYPSSPKVPGAMLKLGYLDYDEQQYDQARVMLQAVVRRFPGSAEGRLAAKRLAEIDAVTAGSQR